jgi:hypothetical protein
MKLSNQDATLFFELMWPLQFFVNQKLNILPSVQTLEDYSALSMDEKIKVRDVLFDSKQWIDAFVKENPQQFSEDKLLMISKWRDFIKDDFYIERFLKKQAIFISSDKHVYGVCGLYDGFDKMIHSSNLPLLIKTVLLPFAGKIIYDGVLQGYNVYFGSGISSDLKETYLIAKQKNRIMESFESQSVTKPAKGQLLKNWEPEVTALYNKAKQLKAGSSYPATYESAFALVKASLEYAQVIVNHSDTDASYKSLKKVARTLDKAYTILEREEL